MWRTPNEVTELASAASPKTLATGITPGILAVVENSAVNRAEPHPNKTIKKPVAEPTYSGSHDEGWRFLPA
jgi:hypothetical protein